MGNCYLDALKPGSSNMDMQPELIQLPCTICNRIFCPDQLRTHLDKTHFMLISDTQALNCKCLICEDVSPTLENHQQHLQECHFVLDTAPQSLGDSSPIQNSELRRLIKEVPFEFITNIDYTGKLMDYSGKLQGEDVYEGYYLGEWYQIVAIEEDAAGLQDRHVVSNLTWKKILCTFPFTKYYSVSNNGGKRRGYLLIERPQ